MDLIRLVRFCQVVGPLIMKSDQEFMLFDRGQEQTQGEAVRLIASPLWTEIVYRCDSNCLAMCALVI